MRQKRIFVPVSVGAGVLDSAAEFGDCVSVRFR